MTVKLDSYEPRLQIFILIHPESKFKYRMYELMYSFFTRDVKNPLLRGLGIPIFFWDPFAKLNKVENYKINFDKSLHTVVIAFVDSKMVIDDKWSLYLEGLWDEIKDQVSHRLIPIDMDGTGLEISKKLKKVNYIRYHKFPEEIREQFLIMSLAHEICRILLVDPKSTTSNPLHKIKLFLSHTKVMGTKYAESIRNYLHQETSLETFFDIHDIPPGFDFEKIIEENIASSCLLVLNTDDYGEREWCRREVLIAKEKSCPIVIINCLEKGENRLFPYIGNVPVVRYKEENYKKLDILLLALQETLRNLYNFHHLKYINVLWSKNINSSQWYRAPEILTCVNLFSDSNNKNIDFLIYPDPPLGIEEISILNKTFPKTIFSTPTQFLSFTPHKPNLTQASIIGFSIAESDDLPINGLTILHLVDAFVEFSRYILATEVKIAYGGDLREHGYTRILFDLARQHTKTIAESKQRIINYLAWPYYKQLTEKEQAKLNLIAIIKRVGLPEDLKEYETIDPDKEKFEHRYVIARSLTNMRKELDKVINCRILLGGKTKDFLGKYPGIVEEAYISLKNNIPIYLVGAFGGATFNVIEALKGNRTGIFDENYFDEKEKEFINFYNKKVSATQDLDEEIIDYEKMLNYLQGIGIKGLNNGLTEEENERLFKSTYIFEIISLVLKGLKEKGII